MVEQHRATDAVARQQLTGMPGLVLVGYRVPQPPFASGSPEQADPAVLEAVLARAEPRQRDRAERVARAAAAL
jgi:hypothetical protein